MEEPNLLPVIPANYAETISTAANVVEQNKLSVTKAKEAGLDLIAAAADGMSETLSERMKEWQEKVKKTEAAMYERRAPITRMLTEITKVFTGLENEISSSRKDNIFATITKIRNDYAAETLRLQQAARKVEEDRIAKERERIQKKADIQSAFGLKFNEFLETQLNALRKLFNDITLEQFEETANEILNFPTIYPFSFHSSINPYILGVLTSKEELVELSNDVRGETLAAYKSSFESRISQEKAEISYKLSGRKSELEAIAEAEKVNIEEANRLKADADKRKAEDEEAARAEASRRLSEEMAKTQNEKAQSEIQAMFAETEASQEIAPVKAKEEYSIQVLESAGWLAIMNFYFQREGLNELPDKLESKTLRSMKLFCEKVANKTDEKIVSTFLKYNINVKAK